MKSLPSIGFPTKLVFSFGAVASSAENMAVMALLMIFYNQVVGLPPATVSAILLVAMVCDALFDPLVGQFSDRLRTRWGRRHPLMYISAIPTCVFFFLLWNPPTGWGEGAIAAYLLICLLGLRLFDTFFELPSLSLWPELFPGYDERARVMALRTGFGMLGNLLVALLAYQVFLKANPDGGGGILARDGYLGFSIAVVSVILLAILASSLATHRYIPYLRQNQARTFSLREMARETIATLSNRSYLAFTASGMIMAVAFGMRGGLTVYFSLFFFELTQAQFGILSLLGTPFTWLGLAAAPYLIKRWGKRNIAVGALIPAVSLGNFTIILRLLDLAPANGTPLLFGMLCFETIVTPIFVGVSVVAMQSMLADVVEDVEVKTGRRSEGLLLSANSLMNKMISSVGTFLSGALLAFVAFPANAVPGRIDPAIVERLAWLVVPPSFLLLFLGLWPLRYFTVDRHTHEQNLARLKG